MNNFNNENKSVGDMLLSYVRTCYKCCYKNGWLTGLKM